MTGAASLGPDIAVLNRRLVDTPDDFLAEPFLAGRGQLNVAALVSDLLVAFGEPGLDSPRAAGFRPPDTAQSRNWLRCVSVATWLLHDGFILAAAPVAGAWGLLTAGLQDMADFVPARDLVTDPDRREELARRSLRALGLLPGGETAAQAADRLATLDSVERARVLTATRDAELRAAEVRKAMLAQAAAEAAAKASRE
jgi:hypothetical protein